MEKVKDTIYRQAAIDAIKNTYNLSYIEDGFNRQDAINILEQLPSAQQENCEGCKHLGKWENEVEYGYSSPCTFCKRRVEDCYER